MSFSFFNKKEKRQEVNTVDIVKTEQSVKTENNSEDILLFDNILIGQTRVTKEEAIERAGKLLADSGYVEPEYICAMQEREIQLTTYIGEGVAIPHGVGGAKEKIIKSGISILQFPEGIIFGEGKVAHLVVGIAGKGNGHMKILTNLAELIQEGEAFKQLFTTNDKLLIYNAFTKKL